MGREPRQLKLIDILEIFARHPKENRDKQIKHSIRAGEITYTHLTGFTYQFQFKIYSNDSSLSSIIISLNGASDTLQNTASPQVNPICYNQCSMTHTFPGLGTYVVSAAINYLMVDVANIQYPGMQPLYLEDSVKILDPAFYGYNNSPLVLNPPVDFATTQLPYIHNPNAYDPDGDSLSFSLVPFFADGYTFPAATDSLSVNALTGELVWNKPTAAGNYAVAILITEWRLGVVIGTELVSMMITVVDPSVGLAEAGAEKNSFFFFPNPTSSYINMVYTIEQNAKLTFVNAYGSVVKQLTLYPYLKNRIVYVDDLPAGVYLVTLHEHDRIISKKMMVKR